MSKLYSPFLIILFISLNGALKTVGQSCTPLNNFLVAQTPVKVAVDPRIELMSVLQVLTNYMLVSQHDSAYKRATATYFSPHKNHQAVRLYVEMGSKHFNFDAVPKIFISLSEPPDLRLRAKPPETAIQRAGGKEKLDEFITALNDFARVSRFLDFYRSNQEIYKKVLVNNRASLEKAVRELGDYSGMNLQGGTVILGMLLHDGGFAATIENGGRDEVYSFIGPVGLENNIPDFGTADRNLRLVAHEFSHSFVNPLTTKHLAEINRYSALYEPIAERMKGQAYPVWEIAVNEHIVRAITSRLAFQRDGAEAGEKALQAEERRGFKYVRALAERLKEYENKREKYSNLAEVYPRLIYVFKEVLETSDFTSDPEKVVFEFRDVQNFLVAYDRAKKASDPARIFAEEYFGHASPGLKAFLRRQSLSPKTFLQAIQSKPQLYGSLDGIVEELKHQQPAVRKSLKGFKEIYPDVAYPPVYFLIGNSSAGGLADPVGILIGVEVYSKRKGYMSNNSLHDLEDIRHLVAHELVHIQQARLQGVDKYRSIYGDSSNLLALAIREGSADFIGELASGGHINEEAHNYGKEHEAELWAAFSKQIGSKEAGEWLFVRPSDPGKPSNLGYFIGYKIVESYYRKAKDKKKAIVDILSVTDYPSFLEQSGYRGKS